LGGLIAALANLVMVSRVFGGRLERDPKRFLGRMVLGEALKFAATVLLFGVVIVKMKAAFLPLILATWRASRLTGSVTSSSASDRRDERTERHHTYSVHHHHSVTGRWGMASGR